MILVLVCSGRILRFTFFGFYALCRFRYFGSIFECFGVGMRQNLTDFSVLGWFCIVGFVLDVFGGVGFDFCLFGFGIC